MSNTALTRDFASAQTADATGGNNLIGYGLMGVAALALFGALMGGSGGSSSESSFGGAGMIAAVLALGAIVLTAMNGNPRGPRGPRLG